MYHHLVSELQDQLPMDIFLLDLRGQGQSKGQEGHINSMDVYLNDIESFINEIKNRGFKTIHIIAHSLGSLIAINMLEKVPQILGKSPTITLSAPFLGIKIPLVQKMTLKFICGFLVSPFYLKNRHIHKKRKTSFNGNDLTRDKLLFEKFQSDPHRIGPPTWGWLKAILNGHKNIEKKIKAINIPILVFLAEEDKIVDNKVIRKVFKQKNLSSPKIELIEIKDTEHALFLAPETVRNNIIKKISIFLKEFDSLDPSQNS